MPIFDFECPECRRKFSDIVPQGVNESTCPGCSGTASRQFSPTMNLKMAAWMTHEAEDINARQKAYMETDEFKEGVKSGKIVRDDGQNHYDGAQNSSSLLTRWADEGITFS